MNKPLLPVLCLALLHGGALAQETSANSAVASTNSAVVNTNSVARISATEAKSHVGAEVIVTGKVAEVNKNERLVRLNLDKGYPNQPFTAIIFADHTNLFPEVEKLKDKSVEVSGKIADYRGRPEIIITSTNQLKVVEKSSDSEKK
jgi:DNA/RNA endonuclease YhcR with UshA esterase domain